MDVLIAAASLILDALASHRKKRERERERGKEKGNRGIQIMMMVALRVINP